MREYKYKYKYIMSVETVKIKEFLFSTNKLKCIQGASYLLDYINNVGIRKILKKYQINAEYISYSDLENILENENSTEILYNKIKNDDVIYIAAGNAKFFVNGTEEEILKIKDEIEKLYLFLAPNSKVVVEYMEINKNKKISEHINEISKKVSIKKNIGFFTENIDLPYLKKCELSNEYADIKITDINESNISEIIYNKYKDNKNDNKSNDEGYVFEEILHDDIFPYIKLNFNLLKEQLKTLCGLKEKGTEEKDSEEKDSEEKDSEEKYISTSTFLKVVFSNLCKNNEKDKISFYSIVSEKFKKIKIYDQIEDYAKSENDRFIGFMYSDGDSVGEYLKNIEQQYKEKENEEYLKFIKTFSIKLDYVTKSSLLQALEKNFGENEETIGSFLIVGGDDVCALFKVEKAINVCRDYIKIFEDKMKKFKMNEITTSSGLLFVKPKTPIHLMFEQSLKLQKSAKQKRYLEKKYKGYIDFQNIGSQGNTNIDLYRGKIRDFNVINRPYIVEDFNKLLENINYIKEKFPKNKLRKIYDIKLDKNLNNVEKNRKILNYLYKIDENLVKKLWEIEDFLNYDTQKIKVLCDGILDIIELYDFLKEVK